MLRVTYNRANNIPLQPAPSKVRRKVNHGRALCLELDGSTRTMRGMKNSSAKEVFE